MHRINSQNIFLIDGVGAGLSALMLLLLFYFESTFGMPKTALKVLIPIAFIFTIYSLSCYLLRPIQWRIFLKIIAVANLLYCCLTIVIVVQHADMLTIFGKIYFLMELIVIVMLVGVEWRLVRSRR